MEQKKKKLEISPNMLVHVTLIDTMNICHINKNNHIDGDFTNYVNNSYVKLKPNSHLLLILCNTHKKHDNDAKQCNFISSANRKRILSLRITNTSLNHVIQLSPNLTLRKIISHKSVQYKIVFIKKKYFIKGNTTFTITLT